MNLGRSNALPGLGRFPRVALLVFFSAIFALAFVAAGRAGSDSSAPIRLDPRNPHYFLFQGRVTALITSGEHYGAVINADFDYRKYLDTLQMGGFNYTRLFGGSYVEVPAKSFGILRNDLAPAPGRLVAPWARSETPGYAGGGNKFDLERWNPAYFERLRDFLAEANRRGIVVEISLFSSQYDEAQWNLSPFNSANNINGTAAIDWKNLNTLENGNILGYQEKYVRKIVREANSFPNVIFEIQNEPWSDRGVLGNVVNPYLPAAQRDVFPNSVDLPDAESMEWQARVAQWIVAEEAALPNRHLVAQNYCNFRFPVRQLIPGVSVVNFHYAYPAAVLLNYGLDKAISYDETGFLGHGDDAYIRQAWNFMLSGGSVFDNLDYSFTPGHEDGTDLEPNGPGGGSPAFRQRLRVLVDFLKALPLEDLRPDLRVVRQARGAVAHALSSPAGTYAIYLDGQGPIDLTLNLPPGVYTASWIDIDTGQTLEAEKFHHQDGEKDLNSPDFRTGITLKLTREQ